MSHTGTALARIPIFLLEQAEALGLDRQELMHEADLTEEDLQDPDARIQSGKNVSLWKAILSRVEDPLIGFETGSQITASRAGLVGYTMMHSANLGDALWRLTRFGRILDEAYPPQLDLTADRAEYSYEPLPEERFLLRQITDHDFTAILTVIRQLTGHDLAPLEVHFTYDRPEYDLSTHRSFLRCKLVFGQPLNKLVFKRQHMDLPVRTADEELGQYLEQLAESVLEDLAPEGSVVDKVERALWAQIKQGRPTLETVAAVLVMSPRTLQRRLSEEETSFVEVLDGLRREMAISLLSDQELAIYEIAFLLGYSEPSTFYRAFRRWTDSSPREYRSKAS